jgi:hypothetical protein
VSLFRPRRRHVGSLAGGSDIPDLPLSWERLTLRADLAYALARTEGRTRLASGDLERADALARAVLARRASRGAAIAYRPRA